MLKIYKAIKGRSFVWWSRKLKNAFKYPDAILLRFLYNSKRLITDIELKFGFSKYDYQYQIIFIAGLPMSATTWVKNMAARIPGYYTRLVPIPYEIAVRQDIIDDAFKYAPNYAYSLFKTHLNPSKANLEIIKRNNVRKVVVTYRDYRDVIVSMYYRLIEFPGNKSDSHYHDYGKYSKEEAINKLIDVVASDAVEWVNGWFEVSEYQKNFVYLCRFEDLRTDPQKEFRNILSFYDIELSESEIKKIITKTKGSGEMGKNLNKGSSLPSGLGSNFRSGKIGGWNDEFSPNNIIYCKNKLGAELIKLGYESNYLW